MTDTTTETSYTTSEPLDNHRASPPTADHRTDPSTLETPETHEGAADILGGVSRRVHSILAAVVGLRKDTVPDGGSPKSHGEPSQESSGGQRVHSETERTSPPDSDSAREYDPLAPICDYCGLPIDHAKRRCPALENGRCRP